MQRLSRRGEIAIGMSPLWYSPKGGLISHTSWLPWAHLLFPEDVIRRARGVTFEDNRMTLRRFLDIMGATGLEQRYLVFNVGMHGPRGVIAALNALRALPSQALRELLTVSVYGIWSQRP